MNKEIKKNENKTRQWSLCHIQNTSTAYTCIIYL